MREIKLILLWAILILSSTITLMAQASTPPTAPVVVPTPVLSADDILKIINPPAKVYTAADLAARAKPVTTDQGFIDDATEAFNEVVALRDLALKFLTSERPASIAERTGAERLVEQLNKLIDGWKSYVAMYGDMVKAQQEFITFQFGVIKQLQDIITHTPANAKKGFWSETWKTIKRVTEGVLIFLAGRGAGMIT